MKKFSPGLLPTLITVPVVIILLALSVWQVNRYVWKVNLVDQINSQLAADPVPLPAGAIIPEDWQYRRVSVTGTFDHENELHLFSHADKGRKGFQIITPIRRSVERDVVLVNRGWVPESRRDPATRMAGLLEGEITVNGIVRKPWGKSWSFMPASNAETNIWLYGELAAMSDKIGTKVAPVFVEVGASEIPGGFPIGGQTRVTIPNNHIQYAFTWLGLALAMIVIFVLYGRKQKSNDSDG
jgi:surfeit locus 1 family protein